jgi:drug/metabolite transporter (DMT)-like permease
VVRDQQGRTTPRIDGQAMSEHAVPQNTLHAVAWMLWAVFLLATMDAAIKQLVAHYPSLQVAVLRCVISAPLFALWIAIQSPRLFRTKRLPIHGIRAVLGLFMLWAVGEAFRELPLADAYAIFFAAPLILTLLSGPVMKEPAGPWRIAACAVGFGGVLVVMKPGADALLSYGSVMALLAVGCYAIVALMVRALGREEHSLTIAFWFTALSGLCGAVLLPGRWQPLVLDHWPWLVVLGVTGTLGQVAIIAAFRRASAGVIAPLEYTALLWAVLYGWWFWGDLPDARTWVGAGIIIASGLFVIHRERIAQRQSRTQGTDD